jgi:hypothetical protein
VLFQRMDIDGSYTLGRDRWIPHAPEYHRLMMDYERCWRGDEVPTAVATSGTEYRWKMGVHTDNRWMMGVQTDTPHSYRITDEVSL